MKKIVISLILIFIIGTGIYIYSNRETFSIQFQGNKDLQTIIEKTNPANLITHPLMISELRKVEVPGSDLKVEEELAPGSNYTRQIVSYQSEGNKIYALLTIPQGEKPKTGWPVVIFNHGFIPPNVYRTTERYIAYTDAFSRNGYIVFRSDYRGHGNSEGEAKGGYSNNDYTIDVLNGLNSVRKLDVADTNRIGMWGHSMGGYITLRSMVVDKDIKAGVIWGGVVGSYPTLLEKWRRGPSISVTPSAGEPSITPISGSRGWRNELVRLFGSPAANKVFWNSISANTYLKDIGGPIQLHHGTQDESVPHVLSEILKKELDEAGKTGELYLYEGDDHDITTNFGVAMQRSVEFFDKYVKGTEE